MCTVSFDNNNTTEPLFNDYFIFKSTLNYFVKRQKQMKRGRRWTISLLFTRSTCSEDSFTRLAFGTVARIGPRSSLVEVLNSWISPTVKYVCNISIHVKHNFGGFVINTTALHLARYSLHLLLQQSSMIWQNFRTPHWSSAKSSTIELFSRRRWRLVSAQLSIKFGYWPSSCTVFFVS